MSTIHLVPDDILELYHVKEWRNATGVLTTAWPEEWEELLNVLRGFKLLQSEILKKGGPKSPIAKRIDSAFYGLGWEEKKFDTAITGWKEDLRKPHSQGGLLQRPGRSRSRMEQQGSVL